VRELLKRHGYDGSNEAEGFNSSWVAFDVSQTKSAQNGGAFDPERPTVMESDRRA
jgi:hypothetical protein